MTSVSFHAVSDLEREEGRKEGRKKERKKETKKVHFMIITFVIIHAIGDTERRNVYSL
jgi:hypothetical protein